MSSNATALTNSLKSANLLPTASPLSDPNSAPLIPATFKPTTQLTVTYNDRAVELGNLFRVSEVPSAPHVSFTAEKDVASGVDVEGRKYTLMLVDPDAPTPDEPKFGFWRHWVVTGLRPEAGVGEGKEVTAYLAPGPKDESKPHRYLFLLFREPAGGLSISKADVGGEEFVERRSFKAADFVQRNGLELVGANWMLGAGDGWKEEA